MTTEQFIQTLLDWLLADPSHLVSAASALAAMTPTPAANTLAGKLYQIVDILALNFLHAKDSGPGTPTGTGTGTPPVPPSSPSPVPAVALAAALAACTTQTPAAALFEARATYDATVLAPLVQYHALPPCPVASGACKDVKVDQQLIQADADAKIALDAAQDVIVYHPGTDPTSLVNDAQQAVAAVQTILTQNGVK